MDISSQIAILACQTCSGISEKLLPSLQMHFGNRVQVITVSCPGNLNPLSIIALLRQGWGGLAVICPKDSCCCPKKVKSILRRQTLKSMLPVFEIYPERLEIITATPFETDKVINILETMVFFVNEFARIKPVYGNIGIASSYESDFQH